MSRDSYSRSDRNAQRSTCPRSATVVTRSHPSGPAAVHGLDGLDDAVSSALQFTIFAKIDMTGCMDLRRRTQGSGTPVTYNDIFVKAAAVALATFPTLNARHERHRIVPQTNIDIGIVIATEGRQTFGSIQDADALRLDEVAAETQRLSQAVWNGESARPPHPRPPAFTVSNLGMYGVSKFSGYVVPHEAALLSIGAIEDHPVATASGVEVRPLAELGLTCDHRVVSAADAAFFLQLVREVLTDDIEQLSAS